ncbi:MAG: protoporphyrinogen/coproporphyrinogen oxidase [Gemmatimonadaceae bacterium]
MTGKWPLRRQGRPPVVIIGAGIAGLIASRLLGEMGVETLIVEAGGSIGGLARSVESPGGLVHDIGAHFISSRLARELGASDLCRRIHGYEEGVYLGGRWHRYPFGFVRIPGALRDFARAKRNSKRPSERESISATVYAMYGKTLASKIVLPQLEAWSGVSADELATSVLDPLPTGLAATVAMHALRRVTRLPIAVGYSKEQTVNPLAWLVYPRSRGIRSIADRLAEAMHDRILLNTPVERITLKNGRVHSIVAGGDSHVVSGAVCTLPANAIPYLLPSEDSLKPLQQLRFCRLLIVNVRFRGRRLLPDVVGWFPEPSIPFFRVTEVPRVAPWLAPDGTSVLTVDFSGRVCDELWDKPEERVVEYALRALESVRGDLGTRYVDASVTKIPLGYPIFLQRYEHIRTTLPQVVRIPGLCIAGRNAEFAHLLMEDVYWRLRRRLPAFVDSIR